MARLVIDGLTETDDVLSGLDQWEALLLRTGGAAELNLVSGNEKTSQLLLCCIWQLGFLL